jgi:LPS export ABC transporter permease LptF/LPS export ABC transporter permease LptG
MFRTLDRYLVREIALPFAIALTVLTFILEIPPILLQAEEFISRGVEWSIVARVLLTLIPQALCLTIPMAVLLGILVGFGRLSGDREFVAIQACGVSLMRLARPVLLVAALGTAATAYETIVALPNANQTFREIVFVTMAQSVEQNVKPRVFYEGFPDKTIYVRDLPREGGWRDVFLADTANPNQTTVYFARQGRIHLDRVNRLVQLELRDGSSHTTHADRPDDYEETRFESFLITLDPATVFRRPPPPGAREMTIRELRQEIASASQRNDPAYDARFMIQQKFTLPLTCPVLALIGLALGATNRKDGRLASFAIGIGVIFVYYVLLWGSRAAAMGGRFSPELAPWMPILVMGVAGVLMTIWRAHSADQPIRFTLPAFWRRGGAATAAGGHAPHGAPDGHLGSRVVVVIRVPHINLPTPKLLDVYISREYLRVFLLGIVGLLGIFYISTFIDLADKLFRGETTMAMVGRFFYFRTPQFVYYVIPMSVLVSTLVTVGVMTKNSELLVMRACGISLYRSAAPLVLFGLVASGALFVMEERVLASANREADRLERVIRHWPAATTALNRRWVVGTGGELYHYDVFDQETNRFTNLLVFGLDDRSWQLRSVTRVSDATLAEGSADHGESAVWEGRRGWIRELAPAPKTTAQKLGVKYLPFEHRELTLEPPGYFKTEDPIAELMTYSELRDYVARLRASGANAVPQMVELHRKLAFPFVTVIMTLLAVPFAVTTGRRGAMYGVGVGIVLAIVYWVTLSVLAALGKGGVLPPALAAWAPNILFGAAAAYGLLTVRT